VSLKQVALNRVVPPSWGKIASVTKKIVEIYLGWTEAINRL